jgi:hypothetical protein
MSSSLHRCVHWIGAPLLAGLVVVGDCPAQSDGKPYTGHAVPGFFGFEASMKPPLGMSYENIAYMYNATTEKDRNGNNTGVSGSVRHISDHFTATWCSPWNIFGGNYVARATVSMGNSAPNPRSLDAGNRGFKMGDTYLEPLALYWPGEKGWATLSAGYWFDTGDFSADSNNNSGKGFQTWQLAMGFVYWPNEERLWNFSLYTRLGMHSKVDGLNLRPGDDLVTDWAFGKHVTDRWNLGLVGYGIWQTSRDKGSDANEEIGFYGTSAIGLGASYKMPSWGGKVDVRLYQELNVYNHTEGQALILSADFLL